MNMEEKVEFLVNWLQDQVQMAKADGLIVGVSGGIDSALVAFLIKKAFPDSSLGVIMPCKSDPADRLDAHKVVEACGIDHIEVDLSDVHNLLFGQVKAAIQAKGDYKEERERMGDGNLRARLRMSTLYSIANNYNYLVVGTDNAAEWHLGYFTKYGDGGVDLVPLINLRKQDVREMARFVGVPEEVITKAPSAGLWPQQTDEKEMGTTYDIIDHFLSGKPIPEKDREIIERLHERSAHKRRLPPSPPQF